MLTVVRISDVTGDYQSVFQCPHSFQYTRLFEISIPIESCLFLFQEIMQKFDFLLHFSGCQLFFGSNVTFMVIQGISNSSCNKTRVIIRILLLTWVLFYLWMWHVHYLYNDTCLFKLTSTDHWIIQKEGEPQHTDEKFLLYFLC